MTWEILGIVIGGLGLNYMFLRNFKIDLKERFDTQDARLTKLEEHMFLLATGKTLREAMMEAQAKADQKRT